MIPGTTQSAVPRTRRLRRQIEYPAIGGKIDDNGVAMTYEVLQVSDGNALVWTNRAQPGLVPTASGGFGWIEPACRTQMGEVDLHKLQTHIEAKLRHHIISLVESPAVG